MNVLESGHISFSRFKTETNRNSVHIFSSSIIIWKEFIFVATVAVAVAASSFCTFQVNLLNSITKILCERALFEITFERREEKLKSRSCVSWHENWFSIIFTLICVQIDDEFFTLNEMKWEWMIGDYTRISLFRSWDFSARVSHICGLIHHLCVQNAIK